jgi:hypothetical protein
MRYHKARIFLVIAAGLFTIMAFPPIFAAVWSFYNHIVGSPKIEAYPWKEPSKEAFSSRIALSKDLFQTALLLIAGMWGLLLVKKDEAAIVFDQWPERVLLLLATVSLLSSCLCYIGFVHVMSSLAMNAAITGYIPDLTHRDVAHDFLSQSIGLIGGASIAAITVLCATWLQNRRPA